MRKYVFEPESLEDFSNWPIVDMKIFKKIVKLLREIKRTPFKGTGKPEPLKFAGKGYWSRRITKEHRLVYKVSDDAVIIVSCKGRYN